jgi:ABC-2 type transport system permease protein
MSTPAQLTALAALLFKHWTRSALFARRDQGPTLRSGAQLLPQLALRALFWGAMGLNFWRIGARGAELGAGRENSVLTLVLGTLGVWLAAPLLPLVRSSAQSRVDPLGNPWLETFPLTATTRFCANVAQTSLFALFGASALWGASPELRATPSGNLLLCGVCGTGFLLTSLIAQATLGLLRAHVPSHGALCARWLAAGVGIPSLCLLAFSSLPFSRLLSAPGRALGLGGIASLLMGGPLAPVLTLLPALGALLVAATFALWHAERHGVEALELRPTAKPRASGTPLDWRGVERLLVRREGAPWLSWGLTLLLAPAAGIVLWIRGSVPSAGPVALMTSAMTLQVASQIVLMRASASVARDLRARSLLCALPVEPRDTLLGKTTALRANVFPLLLIPVAWGALGGNFSPDSPWIWRCATSAATLWLFCDAAVSVAFLSGALAGPSLSRLNLERILVLFPVFGVAFARNFPSSLPPLIALALLTVAGRRAAQRAVVWADDPAALEAEKPPLWRALVVFATFITVQGLGGSLFFQIWGHSPQALAVTYMVSALSLVLMTLSQKERSLRFELWPNAAWLPLVGLGLGTLSALFGHVYLTALTQLGWEPGDAPALGESAGLVVIAAIVIVAPLAEELFFRGWLQQTIAEELPAARQHFAVGLCALAFACVHPPVSAIPVAVLGLVAGTLYRRRGGLLSAVAAHVAHNAVTLWLNVNG